MKGITHGACDYLVKPVRVEELRNIWQHVVRKKVDPKSRDKSNSSYDRDQQESEGGQGPAATGNTDQDGKMSRKRKDEEEDDEENDQDDVDPSAQKKPRVVWSIELHRKFVAAVNQLGLESKSSSAKGLGILCNEYGPIHLCFIYCLLQCRSCSKKNP